MPKTRFEAPRVCRHGRTLGPDAGRRPVDLIERGALGKCRNYIRRRSILRERQSVYG